MSKQIGYRIPIKNKLCKFGQHYNDSVPMPFGGGNCSMPGFECAYDGDKIIPDEFICDETDKCVAYEPCLTIICPKHNIEYYVDGDWCELCHPDFKD